MPVDEPLVAHELYFSYGDLPVLQRVNLRVHPQEWLVVIGPNGGGKTTFLHLLMGFLSPSKGSLRLFGLSPRLARPLIGYVPQNFSFDRSLPLSVFEVVLMGRLSRLSFWGTYSSEDRAEASRALERVGMGAYAHRPFAALSGGQAQRVLLARALASAPKLLLLDEATAHVDASAQAEILAILSRLKGEMTILMVTHDLSSITGDVDRIVCIDRELSLLSKEQVCQHFALGLYHPRGTA